MEIVAVHDQKKPLERPVVAGQTAVTLIGGGALRDNDLAEALDIAPLLVAVDGGADAAMAAGLTPQAVSAISIRSLPPLRARWAQRSFYEISEQDSTDFDKALRHLSCSAGACGRLHRRTARP
jgi:thiamine pyrophosphokinase